MDIGILIIVVVFAFGCGTWFYRLTAQLNRLDEKIAPIIVLHKDELIKYYLERGILPNPGMSARKKYLIDKLEANTISYEESQELSSMLKAEEKEAREAGNKDALIAILGLIALVAVISALSKRS